MKALGCESLDSMTCGRPGCTHQDHKGLFLHGRCHMGAGNEVEYREGKLLIRCSRCKKTVVNVLVSELDER